MDRRSFLRKTGAAAAAAVALPLGVHKLVEGKPPPTATPVRAPADPLGDPLAPYTKQRYQLGWKFQDPRTGEQYGAVLIADADAPLDAIGDIISRQMAETLVEVVGSRRTMALARSLKA